MIRLIVSAIYSVGFWTVAGIIAIKSDTFPNELFFVYTTILGAILTLLKEKDAKDPGPNPTEEKP
jgi:hypothetical protein